MELLHDHKHSLRSLKHALKVYDAWMMQILKDTHWDKSSMRVGLKRRKRFLNRNIVAINVCPALDVIFSITCKIATSFRSWLSCLVGKRILSMTLMATSRFVFLCLPFNDIKRGTCDINDARFKQNSLVVKSVCLHQRSILFVSECVR